MLLKILKRPGPLTIFFIIVILLTLWTGAFVKLKGQFSWYFDLDPMPLYGLLAGLIGTNPLPGVIFSMLLVSFMSFLIVNLNTSLVFINERTFLPALIYILLSSFFPQYQLLNPAIIGSVFLMMAIKRIMESYRVKDVAYNFFDAGILIGTGSLFYANLIWFGLLCFAGIALLRTWNPKEIILSLLGLVTPYVLTIGVYYVAEKDLDDFFSIIDYNLFGRQTIYVFTHLSVVAVIFSGILTLAAISHLLLQMGNKKIQARKTFFLLLWLLFISLGVYIFLPSVSVEIIWITAIPVSYLLTHYLVFLKRKIVTELLFTGLFLIVLLIQILYLG
jgi:hypothetical protein